MTSRYFPNEFDDDGPSAIPQDLFKARALTCVNSILEKYPAIDKNCDGGLYVGVAGVAYQLYYMAKCGHFPEHTERLLQSAKAYITVAVNYCSKQNTRPRNQVSFLLADGGVYAVATLIYKLAGEDQKSKQFLDAFRELAHHCEPIDFLQYGSDELFVGRSGYLLGVLLLQNNLGIEVIPEKQIFILLQTIVESGRKFRLRLQFDGDIPLMYSYYGTLYLGAGHGIAGILQVLLCFPKFLTSNPSAGQMVKTSVDFLLNSCMFEGNMATDLEEALNRSPRTKYLVHWCHGAAGLVYMFARAYIVYNKQQKYLDACRALAETVWKQGLLKKGPGICHGVAGSGYVFILLYRLTRDPKYLYRAERFGGFMFTEQFKDGARTPDSPYSLFEGLAGTACFLNDLLCPEKGEFPLSNIFVERDEWL